MKLKLKEKNFSYVNDLGVDIDIELVPNKLNLLTGRNGIGKTTLINSIQKHYSNVAVCSQHRLSSVNSTRVKDLFKILMSNKLIDQTKLKINIELFKFDALLNREIKELSGGENQTLKILITLASLKELLVFDEPSQYLDAMNLNLFKEALSKSGQKILIVEHNLSYLDSFAISKLKMSLNPKTSKLQVQNV